MIVVRERKASIMLIKIIYGINAINNNINLSIFNKYVYIFNCWLLYYLLFLTNNYHCLTLISILLLLTYYILLLY